MHNIKTTFSPVFSPDFGGTVGTMPDGINNYSIPGIDLTGGGVAGGYSAINPALAKVVEKERLENEAKAAEMGIPLNEYLEYIDSLEYLTFIGETDKKEYRLKLAFPMGEQDYIAAFKAAADHMTRMTDDKSNYKEYHKEKQDLYNMLAKWFGTPANAELVIMQHPLYTPIYDALKDWYKNGVRSGASLVVNSIGKGLQVVGVALQFVPGIGNAVGAVVAGVGTIATATTAQKGKVDIGNLAAGIGQVKSGIEAGAFKNVDLGSINIPKIKLGNLSLDKLNLSGLMDKFKGLKIGGDGGLDLSKMDLSSFGDFINDVKDKVSKEDLENLVNAYNDATGTAAKEALTDNTNYLKDQNKEAGFYFDNNYLMILLSIAALITLMFVTKK